jgi:GTPase SAR1 family protein
MVKNMKKHAEEEVEGTQEESFSSCFFFLCSHKVSSKREENDKIFSELSKDVISKSLLDFVRKAGFRGAKADCREGECGFCTPGFVLTF